MLAAPSSRCCAWKWRWRDKSIARHRLDRTANMSNVMIRLNCHFISPRLSSVWQMLACLLHLRCARAVRAVATGIKPSFTLLRFWMCFWVIIVVIFQNQISKLYLVAGNMFRLHHRSQSITDTTCRRHTLQGQYLPQVWLWFRRSVVCMHGEVCVSKRPLARCQTPNCSRWPSLWGLKCECEWVNVACVKKRFECLVDKKSPFTMAVTDFTEKLPYVEKTKEPIT